MNREQGNNAAGELQRVGIVGRGGGAGRGHGGGRGMPADPQCGLCFEDNPTIPLHQINEHGNYLCGACIVTLFQRAIDREEDYPPRYDDTLLNAQAWQHLLPGQLVRTYRNRVEAYAIQIAGDRIHCEDCNWFLGQRTNSRQIATPDNVYHCYNCPGPAPPKTYCKNCGIKINAFAVFGPPHDCGMNLDDERAEEELAFEGMTRGLHFQFCPHCGRRTELQDACHHMTCTCSAHYCYFCGAATVPGEQHWGGPGQCPLYPHPRA